MKSPGVNQYIVDWVLVRSQARVRVSSHADRHAFCSEESEHALYTVRSYLLDDLTVSGSSPFVYAQPNSVNPVKIFEIACAPQRGVLGQKIE